MKLIQCINGHFYDSDAHSSCPYCITQPDPAASRLFPYEPLLDRTDVSLAQPPARPILFPVPDRLPKPWDDCRVAEQLGSGSTGTVYRLRRTVDYALKVIPWSSEASREQARREYETARKLEPCAHVVRCLDYRETDASSLLIQELAVPWADYAGSRSCSAGDVLDAVLQLCKALSAMERAGILHMDVNPKNIFVLDGVVKLGDFSHAQALAPGERHRRLIGTRPFMAPEIVCGGACSGREDIYSLGITMFLLLTGFLPFGLEGRKPMVRRPEDRIRTVFLDPELVRIVEKAAAFAPEERYAGAEALAEDVAAFMSARLEGLSEPVPGRKDAVPGSWAHHSTEMTWGTIPRAEEPPAPYPFRPETGGSPGSGFLPEDYLSTMLSVGSGRLPRQDVPLPAPETPRMDEVQFTAVAETSAEREEYGVVEIAMYTAEQKEAVLERIRGEFSRPTKETSSHGFRVSGETEVTVRLSAKGAEVEEDTLTYPWNGEYLVFSFDYFVPEELHQKRILFRAEVLIGGVPATTLRFTVEVEAGASPTAAELRRDDVRSAFLSYAREDMLAVTYILQALRKARPDMDLFFDLEKLRSGELWEERLYDEIRKRDRLFLCWSRHAALSEWVDKEWRYMASSKGIEAIEPIPLEGPEECPVPEPLQGLHFNDIETFIRKAAKPEP